eukprot:2924298-Rhodomonas_salina.2
METRGKRRCAQQQSGGSAKIYDIKKDIEERGGVPCWHHRSFLTPAREGMRSEGRESEEQSARAVRGPERESKVKWMRAGVFGTCSSARREACPHVQRPAFAKMA